MIKKAQRFSIRKFNVGVGSVLIGSIVALGMNQNVFSEEVDEEKIEDQLEEIHVESSEEFEEVLDENSEEQLEEIHNQTNEEVEDIVIFDADTYDVVAEHVYKMFRTATSEEDIVNAVHIPEYTGQYSIEITSRLPVAMINREHSVDVVVTFEDGSQVASQVPVTVLNMGPSPQTIVGTIPALTVEDTLPNPEDYITNLNDIRAFYAPYGMEVTVEWGQAYHTKQNLIDNYFGEATGPEGRRVLNRVLVDGERLFKNYTTFVIEEVEDEQSDAELYEAITDHVYKMFRSATTEEDIVNAVTLTDYEGEYTVESTSRLPGSHTNGDFEVQAVVTFEDGSTRDIVVPVTVLGMGPSTQVVENPTANTLNYDDELPNPEDYIANMDEIREFFSQYGMEVTAEWGQAYHSKEDIVDRYFSESTTRTLI